jgi:hypothetical protein
MDQLETSTFVEIPGNKHHGRWTIEVPEIGDSGLFKLLTPQIIEAALEECDPLVRMRNAVVQFPERMIWRDIPGETGGSPRVLRGQNFASGNARHIAVSREEISNSQTRSPLGESTHAFKTMLHELFEEDHVVRLRRAGVNEIQVPVGNHSRLEAPHEVIPDRKARDKINHVLNKDYSIDIETGDIISP